MDELKSNGLKQGPINKEQLMQNLLNAKKVMSKVDSGEFTKGQISENSNNNQTNNQTNNQIDNSPRQEFTNNNKMTEEKIRSSKLPDDIKEAFMKNPSPDLQLNQGVDLDFFNKTKELMGEKNTKTNPPINKKQPQNTNNIRQNNTSSGLLNEGTIVNLIQPIVENVIRETVGEIVDKKIDQILNVQESQSINETLVLKVGNSIFRGKITNMKSAKKRK